MPIEAARVLVVDDVPKNHRLLSELVKRHGYTAVVAESGNAALRILDSEPIDLVLLDMHMPDLDGLAVLEALKARGRIPGLAVLVITGDSDRKLRIEALRAGAMDYVSKPLDPHELVSRMRTLIELAALRKLEAANAARAAEADAFENIRTTLQHLPLCVYRARYDGVRLHPEWVTGDTMRFLGQTPAQVMASPERFDRVHPAHRTALEMLRREVLSGNRMSWSMRYRIANPQREDPWVLDVGSYDRTRGVAIGALFDIDAQVHLEDELATAARKQAEAEASATATPGVLGGLISFASKMAGRKTDAGARRVGSYRLGRKLGEGRGSEVFEATHELLGRKCAIKMIRNDTISAVAAERFHREARITAQLQSTHTITVYDFGVAERDLYFVMELADGLDLKRLITNYGPITTARAVPILEQVCDSLAEAHSLGLVHRDIKPANIMLCRHHRAFDVAKVLDFGVVRHGYGGDDDNSGVQGTPAFMAPEIGLGGAIDGRADIYSLGCVAYWLLTGRSVFDVKGLAPMMMAHSSTPPEPPSRYARLSNSFETIIMQCLEKDPARRPESATALMAMLRRVPLGEDWTKKHAEQWWQTRYSSQP